MVEHRFSAPQSTVSSLDVSNETSYNPVKHEEEESGGDHAIEKTLPHVSLYDKLVTNSWGYELLGWTLATMILIALLITLAYYDNKALSQWRSRLTLNTIIAVMTQLAQMALILPITKGISQFKWLWFQDRRPLEDISYFSQASVGPLGGLTLVWKYRTSLLVWLGILSMILQLLFGPFAQQAVALPTRKINRGSGSIPRTVTYQYISGPQSFIDANGTSRVAENAVDPQMKLAIQNGLIQDNVRPSDLQGSCDTGNCTFDTFTSLGVSASVEDVSHDLIAVCPQGINKTTGGGMCNYTIPQLREFPPFPDKLYLSNVSGDSILLGASATGIKKKNSEPYEYKDPKTLVEFFVIFLSDLRASHKVNYSDYVVALKGTLSLCSYVFDSSIEFGVTTTKVVAQNDDLQWSVDDPYSNSPSIVATVSNGFKNLSMSRDASDAFKAWLQSGTFTGTGQMIGGMETNNFSTIAIETLGTRLYRHGTVAEHSAASLLDLMNNLATSMTNGLQNTSMTPSYQNGPAHAYEVYFDVSWSWLIVPILSIPVTLIFLVTIIRRSWQLKIPVWKSSQLASLLALHPSVRAALGGGAQTQSAMEGAVEDSNCYVQLRNLGDGKWELGKADPD